VKKLSLFIAVALATLAISIPVPAGCSVSKLNATSQISAEMLPHSFKGYELYSWQQAGAWNFTLITGINRNKTTAEIVAPSDTVTPDGWVQIHVVGPDAICEVLGGMPQNESVGWYPGIPGLAPGAVFGFPPADIIAWLDAQSQQNGFELVTVG
jgi:hypothetical protein